MQKTKKADHQRNQDRLKQPDKINIADDILQKRVKLNVKNTEKIFSGPFIRESDNQQNVAEISLGMDLAQMPKEFFDNEYDFTMSRPVTGDHSQEKNFSIKNFFNKILRIDQSKKTNFIKEKPTKNACDTNKKSDRKKYSKNFKIIFAVLIGIISLVGIVLLILGVIGKFE